MKNSDSTKRCKDCNSDQVFTDYSRGEVFCGNCGAIQEENLIEKDPNIYSGNSENGEASFPSPNTNTYMSHDRNLRTEISPGRYDGTGKIIKGKNKETVYRLMKAQNLSKVSNSNERRHIKAIQCINGFSARLGMPDDMKEMVGKAFKEALSRKITKGRNTEYIVASLIYAVFRNYGYPRTLSEIADELGLERKRIGRYYREMIHELDMEQKMPDIQYFISFYTRKLNLPKDVSSEGTNIYFLADSAGIKDGKTPAGLAAAIIYIACKKCGTKITQSQLSKVSGVTEVTIRTRYKEIIKRLGIPMQD
ncbi:MAG: transcription initiation factor IIB [Candidatus Thermoplasmatota archaeon]|jgi:transcription initiation factor TFIIB|nr:transcription initiation factor IIB [Candidatus Thermoplasmatota archaeon]